MAARKKGGKNMRKVKVYSDLEKAEILKEVESVGNVGEVSKKHGIPASTIHTWIKKSLKKDLKDPIKEVKNLRKKLSEKEAENNILRELLKKTHQVFL